MNKFIAGLIIKIRNFLKANKKKIIVGISSLMIASIALGATGATVAYKYIKSNINYTEAQCREIALSNIAGEVVRVKTEVELEDGAIEYSYKIKDNNYNIKEVTVNARYGAITDLDCDDEDYDKYYVN